MQCWSLVSRRSTDAYQDSTLVATPIHPLTDEDKDGKPLREGWENEQKDEAVHRKPRALTFPEGRGGGGDVHSNVKDLTADGAHQLALRQAPLRVQAPQRAADG